MAKTRGRKATPAMKADALCLSQAAGNIVSTLAQWFPQSTQLIIAAGALTSAQNEIKALAIEMPARASGD